MQRRVNGDHIADFHERLDIRMEDEAEFFLNLLRQAVLIGVMQLHTERF